MDFYLCITERSGISMDVFEMETYCIMMLVNGIGDYGLICIDILCVRDSIWKDFQ